VSKKGKKVKQPAYQSAPNPQKVPFAEPENTGSQHPAWQFSIMDLDGPFSCRDIVSVDWLRNDLAKFERMTWSEVEGNRHTHLIDVSGICKSARDRLSQIRQDDIDHLYQFGHFGYRCRLSSDMPLAIRKAQIF